MNVMKKSQPLPDHVKEYTELFRSIESLIEEGRKSAVRQVNTVLIATYWFMGQRIVHYEQKGKARAGYGEELLQKLGKDLSAKYGKGFSERNLKLMRQFYTSYPIRQSVIAGSKQAILPSEESRNLLILKEIGKRFPLSWTHYTQLMRIEESEKRAFYESLCTRSHWSVRQLEREIQAMLYERTSLSKRKELVIKKANESPLVTRPEDEIKDSYVLDFLGLKDEYSESQLEDALINHLQNFLLELGLGFSFVGRQKRFVLDGYEYKMDLVFYHIALKCYVIIDLKLGRFIHSYAGQMNMYLNWSKENLLPLAENNPIGIILCADKDNACAKYATMGYNKIFVSKYQLKLPKPDELQRELERGRDLFMQGQVRQRAEEELGA